MSADEAAVDDTGLEPESEVETAIFEDAPSGGADMDQVSGFADVQSDVAPPTAPSSGGDADVMRMVRELERRLATVETRLEEALEAKERLERQVAAQTEELRVQRAAIARTQRVVRNLSRSEGEAPTEPALREPAKH